MLSKYYQTILNIGCLQCLSNVGLQQSVFIGAIFNANSKEILISMLVECWPITLALYCTEIFDQY